MPKRVVITGGPGTGKSSVVNHLQKLGYPCLPEISREIIRQAQQNGTPNIFTDNPVDFSNLLLQERIKQYELLPENSSETFYDRGIPDIVAYLDYAQVQIPRKLDLACRSHRYHQVFLIPPWESIYTSDNERYENFEQAEKIHHYIKKTYTFYGYSVIELPKISVEERAVFIIKNVSENVVE